MISAVMDTRKWKEQDIKWSVAINSSVGILCAYFVRSIVRMHCCTDVGDLFVHNVTTLSKPHVSISVRRLVLCSDAGLSVMGIVQC